MAGSEKTLIYSGYTHCPLKSVAPPKSTYVDLDELLNLKLDESKTVQVSFTGDANQLPMIKSTRSNDDPNKNKMQYTGLSSVVNMPTIMKKCVHLENWKNKPEETEIISPGKLTDCPELLKELDYVGNLETETNLHAECDLQPTDSYLSGKSESDDEVSVVIADYCLRDGTGADAHYITTHEIQLVELDHDVDDDLSTPSSWDIDDDHQVYSFVDYASVDSDETIGPEESSSAEVHKSAKRASPDQSAQESQSTGHIHLSIKATSRAISEPSNVQEKHGGVQHTTHTEDMSRVLLDTKKEDSCDGAKCLIALPGRLHFGIKSKSKDVTGFSSGTSSAISELDDADKEVRNLTARAFKSLAYPYFDAISFSTSSESSASEHGRGINAWSLVDLKYGNMNVSKAGDHNIVAHQHSARSNFQLANKTESNGITGLTLTSRRAPPVEIFALNGNLLKPKNTSTKQFELMGKFGQGPSGIIRLTETLNFRCNVKAGAANERRAKSSRSTGGSRSADEVTRARSGAHSKPPRNLDEAMEDSHKKSIFASSLLKNVISKKMQFEQERKMERGEISEPCSASSPCASSQETEPVRDREAHKAHRQCSKLSGAESDFSIVCLDELGDIVDSESCSLKDDSCHSENIALASETNLDPTHGAALHAKKGASEANRSALIRSQNSAFRSWRVGQIEELTERKKEQTSSDALNSKLTKMSRLFVPSIQVVSGQRELAEPDPNTDSGRTQRGGHVSKSKSPEIKISLRSFRETRSDPFSMAKLLTPTIGSNTAKAGDESKYQALTAALKNDPSEKVPHFTVRDVRDKSKPQAPIHQVRDVRKLVKSSYNFGSVDSNEKTSNTELVHRTSKQNQTQNPSTMSPIVIKCQSVNTNDNLKQSESTKHTVSEDILEKDGPYPVIPTEGIKISGSKIKKSNDRMSSPSIKNDELKIETRTTTKKQDTDKISEPSDTKMVALEKLQAAVKTMEQLYVFDKNEWKRKSKPHPITDSHVLSLISSETDQEDMTQVSHLNADKFLPSGQQSTQNEDKQTFKMSHSPVPYEKRSGANTLLHFGETSTKNISSQKSLVPLTPSSVKIPEKRAPSSVSISSKAIPPKTSKLPLSLKITQSKPDREKLKSKEAGFKPVQFTSSADSENYITIPVKPQPIAAKQFHLGHGSNTKSHGDSQQSQEQSSILMETQSPDTPTATIYHHPLPITMQAAPPQVFCLSPTVQPSPVPTDLFHPTQRKMLLDPTTGNYYLVDTPVQPATRRLFDPETGQYVDIPMPQQPPMTPLPMPISPLALSPGGYGHTYMIYPGYMATTVIPARTIQSQLSMPTDGEAGDKVHTEQQGDRAYMESPYYMPSGKNVQATLGAQNITTGKAHSKVPVISITSQQGPRIIAPPSFDGTTMSFVVEHR
ncbi:uncharacterized protein C4orf54 homolog [Trichomycterus rosablanca]|uniref:uncharacterized protein C4orf54 homolog n=1 Tax=Trichomycterus rosablanca TaxID=2290929 RepID=UPI002F35617C